MAQDLRFCDNPQIRVFLVVLSLAPLATSRSVVRPWPVPRVSVRRVVPSNSGRRARMRSASGGTKPREFCTPRCTAGLTESGSSRLLLLPQQQSAAALIRKLMTSSTAGGIHTSRQSRCAAVHCHLPAATHNVRSHWMSPADGPASPSCTRAMPQAAAVAYTASTLGAAARCSKSTSFLPLMPLSRLVARHSRMLSRSYGGRVCGAVACVWPVLTRLLSVSCPGHKKSHTGSGSGAQ